MATARQTIQAAARKLREVARGETIDSELATIGLTELNAMLAEYDEAAFLPYQEVHVDQSVTVARRYPAQRLICKTSATVTLPAGTRVAPVQDGFRVQVVAPYSVVVARNGWLLEGAAANQTLSGATSAVITRSWFFRADLGDWRRLTTLALDDALPFPSSFDAGIALLLAQRLSGELGQSLGPIDSNNAVEAKKALYARYAMPPETEFETAAAYAGGASIWFDALPEETTS